MRLIRGKRRRGLGVNQVLRYIENLSNRSHRLVHLLGYRSNDIAANFRKVIIICNSVSIILLEFDVLDTALRILKRGLATDVQLYYEGEEVDRDWFERPLIYINFAYLVQKLGDYQSSLKFLYDAENLLTESKDSPEIRDLTLAHAMLSFLVLFKIHKYPQAAKFIEIASSEYNSIISNERRTRFNSLSCVNLYCLITLGLEVLREADENVAGAGKRNLNEALNQLPSEATAAMSLLGQYLNSRSRKDGFYIILSEEFQNVLFVTCFFPFIDPSTPIIGVNALYRARRRRIHVPDDMYALVIEETLSGKLN